MSTLTPKENSKVILNSPQDWEQWHTDFKSMAIMCKVWDYIQGKKNLLLEPIRPPFEDFAVKKTAAITRSQSAGPTRGQPTSTITIQEETTLGPETAGSVSGDIPPSTRPFTFKTSLRRHREHTKERGQSIFMTQKPIKIRKTTFTNSKNGS